MADLPLTYFQLNANYEGLVADTGDPGLSPDFFRVYMDLTLNPRIEGHANDDTVLLSSLVPPITALMVPIPAAINNGQLVLPRQSAPSNQTDDPTQSNIPGVRLWAKSALLGIGSSRLIYDVIPGVASIYGRQYQFDPFTFAAPDIEPPMPYTITISGAPTGGTYLPSVNGAPGTALAPNASSTNVAAALVACSTVGAGNVAVVGSAGGPYTATFGGALAGQAVALTLDGSLLSGGTLPAVNADVVVSTVLDLTTVPRIVVPA